MRLAVFFYFSCSGGYRIILFLPLNFFLSKAMEIRFMMESHIGQPWVILVVLKGCNSSPLQARVGPPHLLRSPSFSFLKLSFVLEIMILQWLVFFFFFGGNCRVMSYSYMQSADFFRADNPEGIEARNEVMFGL